MPKTNKLNFEYCECGCKGYSATKKGLSYWIYWDLAKSFIAHTGHGYQGNLIKDCETMKLAEKSCQKHYDSID